MIKTLENGLRLMPGNDGIDNFLFDSSKVELSLNYIKANNIKRVMLNPFYGYKDSDLKSLIPVCDIIEELIIGSEKISYGGLNMFHNLRLLGIPDNKKDAVDLNNFPHLIILNCSVTNRLIGLENCKTLRRLTISDFKPKIKDLSTLPVLNNLEYLNLVKTDITTLNGINRLSNLRKLEIFSAAKLESIEALKVLSGSLEEIELEKCKKINDYEILKEVKSLKKIILLESGEMKSLAFVKELPHLEFISFWDTNVLDGNIKYCEGINYVGFDNKRHYTHKSEQFKK